MEWFKKRKEEKIRKEVEERQELERLDKIVLVKQSYEEAMRSGSVKGLELIGSVHGISGWYHGADRALQKEAATLNATHVFGISYAEYRAAFRDQDRIIASGDAYKSL